MRKRQQRAKLKAAPFPAKWSRSLESNFPIYARLSDQDRGELQGHIQVFLAEKRFEGCAGLDLNEEMKICIAAQACLLLLHRDTDYYPRLRSILVYPSTYFAKTTRHLGAGVMAERHDSRLGEAWDSGAVVLAWDAVHAGASDPGDGHNVVFHEFAHLLDFEDGWTDGAPLLGAEDPWYRRKRRYKAWARVLGAVYEKLRIDVENGESSPIDEYGTTNPAEFFAVATESFFERALEMKQRYPDLYEELKQFYKQDPACWPMGAHPRP
ncbi:MAG TPA: M90 family metallopeptidase [Patescibacteria group bacterium]|nr:M90 family metallopeptidase [Patescibacteria group bacterium]